MAAQTDTYRVTTLSAARAAALQAIETMWEDGITILSLHAERTQAGVEIAVTYDAGEPQ